MFPYPLVLGHRGAPLDAPENSLRSLSLAMDQGADGVELDVQRSRDGVPVVIHDDTLDRTTSVRGRVADHPWRAIERLAEAQVPSLEQVAAWAAARSAWLNVEIKAPAVEEETLAVLRRAQLLRRVFLSSFDASIVRRVRALEPEATCFLLTERWDAAALAEARATAAHGVCLGVEAATPAALEELRSLGLPVVVWTVDEPERIRALLEAGVAGLITNRPAVGAAVREEWRTACPPEGRP